MLFLTVTHVYSDGTAESRRISFALAEVERAAVKAGMYTVEEYEIIVRSLHAEHVYRVFRVKRTMEAHPVATGVPPAVRSALSDLQEVESLMSALKIARLPAPVIHERMAGLTEV